MMVNKIEITEEIFYGPDSLKEIENEIRKFGSNILLVSDEMIKELGYVDEVINYISKAGGSVYSYLGANSEPTDKYVDEALEICKANNCDAIVAIGGGSCMDTAKAVSVVATNGGYIGDYMNSETIAKKEGLPLITIPTTAGTGSEVTNVTVINNTKDDVKMMIKQNSFLPDLSIVDPKLTISSPENVTAATGMDALCHAIESYISNISHPMTRTFSLEAANLILNNIQEAFDNGENIDARNNMSLAATEAGIAFSNASVTLVHGMSRPIGAMFHIPHGVSNSMLLPVVLEFTKESIIDELADIAKLFLSDEKIENKSKNELADETIKKVKQLSNDLKIPNLKIWGVEKEEFEKVLDKMATDAIDSGSPGYNPKVPSQEEIVELYRRSYDYDFNS